MFMESLRKKKGKKRMLPENDVNIEQNTMKRRRKKKKTTILYL